MDIQKKEQCNLGILFFVGIATLIIGFIVLIRGDSAGYIWIAKGFEARFRGFLFVVLGSWLFWKGTRVALNWQIHPAILLVLIFLGGTLGVEIVAHSLTLLLRHF